MIKKILIDLKNTILNNLFLIVVFLLILGIGYYVTSTHISNIENKYLTEIKLNNALKDEMKTYVDEKERVTNEKLTIQAELKDLKDKHEELSENQKKLLDEITNVKRDKELISAAYIKMQIELDNLKKEGIFINDSTVVFEENSSDLKYKISVFNVYKVKEYNGVPTLSIEHFQIPNEQFISFQWDKSKRDGYPISFTVKNSSPYIKVYDIDSYSIPELQKEYLKPTFWNKTGNFFKGTGGRLLIFGGGVLVGGKLMN